MQRPSPTRQHLYALERRIELAERGHEVLQRKLEAMVLEFMDVLDRYESTRATLGASYGDAQSRLDRTRAMEGGVALDGIAHARATHPTLVVSRRNVMGVGVPLFEVLSATTPLEERGYGLLGTDPIVDEVVDGYEGLVVQVVAVAELRAAVRVLIDEITTTRRRVNALQKHLLPKLRADAAYIRDHLAEREREERIRQKWYKQRKGRGARDHRGPDFAGDGDRVDHDGTAGDDVADDHPDD